jgi:hypothetical protein
MTDTAQSNGETVLNIDLIGFPPGSCRGVQMTLKLIQEAASFRRTVNYTLKNTAPELAKKYAVEMTCTDTNAPALNGIFPGTEIVIDCVSEINRLTAGAAALRAVVPGSEYTVGDFTISRPRLNMTVTDFQLDTTETDGTVGWRLTAEET